MNVVFTEKTGGVKKIYHAASRGIWRLAIKKIRGFCEAKPQDFFTKTSSPAVLRLVQRKPLRFYTEFSLVSIENNTLNSYNKEINYY